MPCTLSPSRDVELAREIISRANLEAGATLVSDQALAEAQRGDRDLFLVFDTAATPLTDAVGVVIAGAEEFDLVIDVEHRGHGFGSCALRSLIDDASAPLKTWMHGENPAAEHLLQESGFQPIRTLVKMKRNAMPASAPTAMPEGYSVRAFTESDIDAWVALNARVFREHPEQGRMTANDVASRVAEPWFNADDFLLLCDASGEITGYCWLKITPEEREVYVIGIAPEHSGRGLGAALFDRGLMRLSPPGDESEVTLYVEGDNHAARALYQSRGFTEALRSTQWMLTQRSQ